MQQTLGAGCDPVCLFAYLLIFIFQAKTGLMMNVIGVLCVFLSVNTWGRAIFDLDHFPDWANVTHIKT